MKVQLINSAVGMPEGRQYAMSCVVNETVALDAGCIGFVSPLAAQKRIAHIFLSHTHIDHVASLPVFLDNVYEPGCSCPTVYGSRTVLDCLQEHFFNDCVWPDLVRVSNEETPFLRLQPLESGTAVCVNGLTITPVELNHVIPTMGFVVDDGRTAVATVWDTLPTEEIWKRANSIPHLKGVFLEASFPDSMEWLAQKTGHLTTRMFCDELQKLEREVHVVAVHIKPAFREVILSELAEWALPHVEVGSPGAVYQF
jgi:cAMP phosphodiesterase